MQKKRLFIIPLIFLLTLLQVSIVRGEYINKLNIYFIPESGFLRVDMACGIGFETNELKLKLFSGVQIVDLHLPNSKDYDFTIQRLAEYTIIDIIIDGSDPKDQVLELMYEGFLKNYTTTTKKALKQELFWYPVITGPVQNFHPLLIKLSVPVDYNPILPRGQLVDNQLSTFSTFVWEFRSDNYPEIYIDGDYFNEPESKSPFKDLPSVDTKLLLERIAEFDAGITSGKEQELLRLIHPDFPNKAGFINFMTGRPLNDAKLKSVIGETISIDNNTIKVESKLMENGIDTYRIESHWSFWEKDWLLSDFKMVPLDYNFMDASLQTENSTIPPATWINELMTAIEELDLPWLDYHLVMPIREKLNVIEFLTNVKDSIRWDSAVMTIEGNKIALIIQEDVFNSRFLLSLSLYPEQSTWKVNAVTICPLFY